MHDTKTNKVKPLPKEQPLRYILTAKAERGDNARWMMTDFDPQGDRSY